MHKHEYIEKKLDWYTVEPAMRSQPCDKGKMAFQGRWLLIGGLSVYKMSF